MNIKPGYKTRIDLIEINDKKLIKSFFRTNLLWEFVLCYQNRIYYIGWAILRLEKMHCDNN